MNTLPREQTAPWESDCRRCGVRVLGAFDQAGQGVLLDAGWVVGGDIELRPLDVGFRALRVKGDGDTERYVRHQCAVPAAVSPFAASENEPGSGRVVMPFGKYRGEYVADLPRGYVRWCVENLEFREPALKRALESVLEDGDD